MKKNLVIINLTISLALLVAIFFLISNLSLDENEKQQLELNVAYSHNQAFALIYVAKDLGYFEDENLKVNFRRFTYGKDGLEDVLKGNSDLTTVYETPFIRKRLEGSDIKIVSSLHRSQKATGVIAHKSNGINRHSDLKNKKIGYTKGINTEFFVRSMFSTYNITYEQKNMFEAEPDILIEKFKAKELDAIALFEPHLLNVTRNNSEVITFYPQIYIENSVLAGRSDVLEKKQEAVVRFLKALARAQEYVKNNQGEAKKIVAKELKEIPQEDIFELWDIYQFTLNLDHVLLEILNRQAETMHELENQKEKKEVEDFRNAIEPKYLKQADEKSVTVS